MHRGCVLDDLQMLSLRARHARREVELRYRRRGVGQEPGGRLGNCGARQAGEHPGKAIVSGTRFSDMSTRFHFRTTSAGCTGRAARSSRESALALPATEAVSPTWVTQSPSTYCNHDVMTNGQTASMSPRTSAARSCSAADSRWWRAATFFDAGVRLKPNPSPAWRGTTCRWT